MDGLLLKATDLYYLSIKRTERGGGGANYAPFMTMKVEGQKHPITNRVKMEPFFVKPLNIFTK